MYGKLQLRLITAMLSLSFTLNILLIARWTQSSNTFTEYCVYFIFYDKVVLIQEPEQVTTCTKPSSQNCLWYWKSAHIFFHSNFITCICYPCAPGSSLNCQHCVFGYERWTSRNNFLTHYTHTDQRTCSIHRLKTCWLSLVVKLFGGCRFRLSVVQFTTKISKLWNFRHFWTNVLRLTYSARTLSSQPLMRLRYGFYSAAALHAMQSSVIPTAIPAVCPSVRLSHAGTLSRRMNIGLRGLHCEVAKTL